jgi:hypothetical protein
MIVNPSKSAENLRYRNYICQMQYNSRESLSLIKRKLIELVMELLRRKRKFKTRGDLTHAYLGNNIVESLERVISPSSVTKQMSGDNLPIIDSAHGFNK